MSLSSRQNQKGEVSHGIPPPIVSFFKKDLGDRFWRFGTLNT